MRGVVAEGARLRIGEQLVREGLISREQLAEGLARQSAAGTKLVATLISLGHIEQGAFLAFLSRQPGIASIHLAGYDVPGDILGLVPPEFARAHEVIPMDRMGSLLTVGMVFPLDSRLIEELHQLTGLRIKPLLVAPEAIQIALAKYYPAPTAPAPAVPNGFDHAGLSATLNIDRIMALVRGVASLPAMPDSVRRVQEAVEDPDLGAADVADILKHDPALSAKVLSLANAPAHGLRHRIDSIETATAMLGLREVYTIALSAALVEQLNGGGSFDYGAHWRRANLCGSLAKILARATGKKLGSGLFAAGLLHDIGRAVLAQVVARPYGTLDHRRADHDLIQAELDTFGIAHPEVGFILAESWAFPPHLAACIRFHHQPGRAEAHGELVRMIALAAQLTDFIEMPEIVPFEPCATGARAMGIEEHQLTGILDIARALRNSNLP